MLRFFDFLYRAVHFGEWLLFVCSVLNVFFGYISRRAQQKTTGGVILYRNLFLECHYLASLSHMYTQKNIVINMLLSAIQSC